MKETQDLVQSVKKDRTSDDFFIFVIAVKHFLGQLNVPVRKLIPDEVVEDVTSYTEFKLIKVFSDFSNSFIEVVENPTICNVSCLTSSHFRYIFTRHIQGQTFIVHKDVTRDVPNLVNEVPRSIHFLVRETHVLTWCRTVWKEPTKGISTIFFDNIHWVNTVTEGLRHLTSLLVTDKTVDKDILKWLATCEFQGLEDHTRHPEEDDVITSDQCWCWEVTFEVFWVDIRPAHSWEWPEGRTEPSIQDIFVLFPAVTFWCFFANVHFTLSIVPSRNLVTPPKLTRNYPVVDIFHPLKEGIVETWWVEINLIVCILVGNSIFGQLVHLNEPLCRQTWFNRHTCTLWVTNWVSHLFDFDKGTDLFQFFYNSFACFKAVHTVEFTSQFIHGTIIVHDIDLRKIVTLTN